MMKLAALFSSLILSVSAFAYSQKVGDVWWYYDFSSQTSTVLQNDGKTTSEGILAGDTYVGALTTPTALGGAAVGGIDTWAFYNCSNLTALVVSEGVKDIGEGTFVMCVSLTTLTLPMTLESIGANAFVGCGKLATVNVGVGETARIKALLQGAGADVGAITFVEPTPPEPIVTYTVNFDPGEGTGKMEALACRVDCVHKLPTCDFTAPQGKGKHFAGWIRESPEPRRYDPEMLFFNLGKAGDVITFKAIWE